MVESKQVLLYRNKLLMCIFQNATLVFLNAIKKYWIVKRQFICREAVFNTHLVYENRNSMDGISVFTTGKKTTLEWFSFTCNHKDNHNRKLRYEKTPMEIHRGHFRFIFRIKPLALSDSSVN